MSRAPFENPDSSRDRSRHWDDAAGLGWRLWRRAHSPGLIQRRAAQLAAHIPGDPAPLAALIGGRWGPGGDAARSPHRTPLFVNSLFSPLNRPDRGAFLRRELFSRAIPPAPEGARIPRGLPGSVSVRPDSVLLETAAYGMQYMPRGLGLPPKIASDPTSARAPANSSQGQDRELARSWVQGEGAGQLGVRRNEAQGATGPVSGYGEEVNLPGAESAPFFFGGSTDRAPETSEILGEKGASPFPEAPHACLPTEKSATPAVLPRRKEILNPEPARSAKAPSDSVAADSLSHGGTGQLTGEIWRRFGGDTPSSQRPEAGPARDFAGSSSPLSQLSAGPTGAHCRAGGTDYSKRREGVSPIPASSGGRFHIGRRLGPLTPMNLRAASNRQVLVQRDPSKDRGVCSKTISTSLHETLQAFIGRGRGEGQADHRLAGTAAGSEVTGSIIREPAAGPSGGGLESDGDYSGATTSRVFSLRNSSSGSPLRLTMDKAGERTWMPRIVENASRSGKFLYGKPEFHDPSRRRYEGRSATEVEPLHGESQSSPRRSPSSPKDIRRVQIPAEGIIPGVNGGGEPIRSRTGFHDVARRRLRSPFGVQEWESEEPALVRPSVRPSDSAELLRRSLDETGTMIRGPARIPIPLERAGQVLEDRAPAGICSESIHPCSASPDATGDMIGVRTLMARFVEGKIRGGETILSLHDAVPRRLGGPFGVQCREPEGSAGAPPSVRRFDSAAEASGGMARIQPWRSELVEGASRMRRRSDPSDILPPGLRSDGGTFLSRAEQVPQHIGEPHSRAIKQVGNGAAAIPSLAMGSLRSWAGERGVGPFEKCSSVGLVAPGTSFLERGRVLNAYSPSLLADRIESFGDPTAFDGFERAAPPGNVRPAGLIFTMTVQKKEAAYSQGNSAATGGLDLRSGRRERSSSGPVEARPSILGAQLLFQGAGSPTAPIGDVFTDMPLAPSVGRDNRERSQSTVRPNDTRIQTALQAAGSTVTADAASIGGGRERIMERVATGPRIDMDDLVEKTWKKFMTKLAIEQERRGYIR